MKFGGGKYLRSGEFVVTTCDFRKSLSNSMAHHGFNGLRSGHGDAIRPPSPKSRGVIVQTKHKIKMFPLLNTFKGIMKYASGALTQFEFAYHGRHYGTPSRPPQTMLKLRMDATPD